MLAKSCTAYTCTCTYTYMYKTAIFSNILHHNIYIQILRINHQWDQEYKELKRLYDDSTTCVPSNTTTNGVMDIKKLQEQLMTVKSDRDKIDRKYGGEREWGRNQKRDMHTCIHALCTHVCTFST